MIGPMVESAVYSIGAVARMVGVPVTTLRTWEKRYGVILPERSAGRHRLFSRRQVEDLRFVMDRIDEGHSPGDAHRLLAELHAVGSGPALVPTDPVGTILVQLAESDPFAAKFAEFFLRTEGYEVVVALDADEAMRTGTGRPPQVAVVDLLISRGKGLSLCRRLADHGVPVVAISTLDLRDAALEAGASAFLHKPTDPLALVSAVKDVLGRSVYLRTPARRP
jgi:CheY-like chemotaxis protein